MVKRKSKREVIISYLTIISVSLGIIITLLFTIPEKLRKDKPDKKSKGFMFFGKVVTVDNMPVREANLIITLNEQDTVKLGTGITSSSGSFNFIVNAYPDETLWLHASKGDSLNFSGFVVLTGSKKIVLTKTK